MNNELLFLIKKHTDTLIEQTKTKLQETFDFRMNKQMESFSFSPPINLVEEGKWLLTVTSFEPSNSVFNITKKNNSFRSLHQVISLLKEVQKLFISYRNY